MRQKWIILGIITALLIAFLAWLFIESSKPLPGTKIADLGRGHVQIGTEVNYNSNPPTSGKHYEDWIRVGVYEESKDDRNLVHSLEHGYVIMHYKCQVTVDRIQDTGSSEASPLRQRSEASGSAKMDDQCKIRKDQLAQIYEKKGKHKLIVVPRSNLETNFALTAWGYLDKFDQFDEGRIVKFIDVHIEQGPEKTMEP